MGFMDYSVYGSDSAADAASQAVIEEAKKWWGTDNPPISMADVCGEEKCDVNPR